VEAGGHNVAVATLRFIHSPGRERDRDPFDLYIGAFATHLLVRLQQLADPSGWTDSLCQW
jgi:hypothetical protein